MMEQVVIIMCRRLENIGSLLLGIGIGLLASLLVTGGFLRILIALGLIALSQIISAAA